MTLKTRKKYVSPSMQAIGIQMELLLCGSTEGNKVNGMNPFPSDPGSSGFYDDHKSIW